MTHADLEEWAGRGLTEAQANLLFEQIQSEVDDNIVAHCTNVITDFDFGDEPAPEAAPPSPPDRVRVRGGAVAEFEAMLESYDESLTYTEEDIADKSNESAPYEKKYPIIALSLTYITRKDILEWWDEEEDGLLTDAVAERIALELEGTIENMLEDRWKDMMLDAIRDALDKLSDGGE